MFKYISEIDFSLPEELLDQVRAEGSAFSGNTRNPIYKQITNLITNGYFDNKAVDTFTLKDEFSQDVSIPRSELLEIIQRFNKWQNTQTRPLGRFVEKSLDLKLQKEIIKHLPKCLQDLSPVVAVQTKKIGTFNVPPHFDHYRTSTLWYLIHGNDEDTVFWEPTEDFPTYSYWRNGDIDKLTEAGRFCLKEHVWYVFDNSAYHSVESTTSDSSRTTLCIEFDNISANKLYDLYDRSRT